MIWRIFSFISQQVGENFSDLPSYEERVQSKLSLAYLKMDFYAIVLIDGICVSPSLTVCTRILYSKEGLAVRYRRCYCDLEDLGSLERSLGVLFSHIDVVGCIRYVLQGEQLLAGHASGY